MAAYAGKILEVDLTTGKVTHSTVDKETLRKFIGGSGLAAKLFFDRDLVNVEPLSDKNVLFLMAGPLSGTTFPTSSRLVAAFKSPQTGIWGQASAGGSFAAEMKKAGYDGIAISGASSRPVYLVIEDDKVEIKDAEDLWGKDCYETINKSTVHTHNSRIMNKGCRMSKLRAIEDQGWLPEQGLKKPPEAGA